ncbi:hypothetical protein POM88_049166 [Heracleum sosnowskyi]|uniref:Uncharacterized protein n=1 Tax=Heracleum sosnowskyi TaxID=360622 RepID=A0AAD8GV57_9APIA|nr:hypothetical protein POM88_049166 [Heracleum sosnowskyi]
MAQVREKLKKGNPDLGSPSDAQVYLDSHEREEDQDWFIWSNFIYNLRDIERLSVLVYLIEINKKVVASEDASELIANGKTYGREWLKGRHVKTTSLASALASVPDDDPFLDDLAEANPGLNLDIVDYCATVPSKDDENETQFTVGTST